jgi:hypothetical protein
MRHEVLALDPHRLARICAVIDGALVLVGVVLVTPVFLLAGLLNAGGGIGFGLGEAGVVLSFFVLYPVLAVLFGWISGFLIGVVYNAIVGWTGGLRLDLRAVEAPPAPTPPL